MEYYYWISFGLAAALVIALYVYKYVNDKLNYWQLRGVPVVESKFRSFIKAISLKNSLPSELLFAYQQLAPHRYGELFTLGRPALMIRDPELIKKIMTTDFHHFHDREIKLYPDVDPLSKQLFAMKGEQWKNLRIKMTTTFSSGKLKVMIPLIEECALELARCLAAVSSSRKMSCCGAENVDIKDFISRYLIDSISSCAFGINMGSLKNPNTEFRLKTEKHSEFRYRTLIRFFIPNLHPKLIKLFGLTFIDKNVSDYFTALVKEVLEYRLKNKVVRNDFLNLLINMKNNFDLERARAEHEEIANLEQMNLDDDNKKKAVCSNVEMTLEVMVSQCYQFLVDGFESTVTTMSFLLFEVAQRPEVQEKLKTEIDAVLQKHDNQVTYYALNDLKYMDMVLAETLRMYPPAPGFGRLCTVDYKIPGSDLVISQGTAVFFPIIGLHYDEQYYRNPKEFNPENFDENAKQHRHQYHQYTYLPFGGGPRVCIAERFAKILMKIALLHLIRNYEFRLSSQMQLPIQLTNNSLGLLSAKDKIWLHLYNKTP